MRLIDRSILTMPPPVALARIAPAIPWLLAAVVSGAAIAVLPIGTALLLLGSAVLLILSLIDFRVALIVLLTAAPLKTLLETEIPGLAGTLDIGQLLLLATIAIWAIRSIAAQRRLDLHWTPLFVPIIALIILLSLSMWTTLDARHTLKELALWMQIVIMIVLVVSVMLQQDTHGGMGWIVAALIAAASVQALIGLYEFRGGSGAPPLWILDYHYFRAFGSFGQPNPFGAFMGLTLPLAIGATIGAVNETVSAYRQHLPEVVRRWGLYSLLALAGVGILLMGLVISWSRGAWLGAVAAAMVLLLFAPRRRWIGIALVVLVIGGGILAAVTGLAPASLVARFSDFSQELAGFTDVRGQVISDANYAVLERFAHWQAAFGMANDSPWLGIGLGAYEVAYPKYELMNWPFALSHAHNYYLNLLAETGIVGLSAYLAAWIVIIAMTIRVLRHTTGWRRGIALGLLGVWTHFSVHSFFDYLLVNNMFLHVGAMLGLIGGLLLITRRSIPQVILVSDPNNAEEKINA